MTPGLVWGKATAPNPWSEFEETRGEGTVNEVMMRPFKERGTLGAEGGVWWY